MQLLPLLTAHDTSSLQALNRRLWAYIEGEYHQNPHRALDGQPPLDRWATLSDEVRYVGPDTNLDDLFLLEAKRRVWKDRTVSLHGKVYEIDATLVGETVLLRFDPSKPGRQIQVWHQGKYIHQAKVVDAYANCFVKRNRPSQNIEITAAPSDHSTTSNRPGQHGTVRQKAGLQLSTLATATTGDNTAGQHQDGGDSGDRQ